jgi:SAM-dependent methyltransferase
VPRPWLRAALAAFAEDVRDRGPVLDVGCAPGAVTAYLAGLGVDASGVDLSPRMIAHARRLHPWVAGGADDGAPATSGTC